MSAPKQREPAAVEPQAQGSSQETAEAPPRPRETGAPPDREAPVQQQFGKEASPEATEAEEAERRFLTWGPRRAEEPPEGAPAVPVTPPREQGEADTPDKFDRVQRAAAEETAESTVETGPPDTEEAEEERPTKRRRRRRRGRRKRPEREAEAGDDQEAADDREQQEDLIEAELVDEDEDEDEEEKKRPRRRRRRRPAEGEKERSPEAPEAADTEMSDEDIGGAGARRHKNIPTWEEAIGTIVRGNLEARSKTSRSRSGNSRGRGGRGRNRQK